MINASSINHSPNEYLMHLTFYDLKELIDLEPPQNSLFLNVETEPFSEEGYLT